MDTLALDPRRLRVLSQLRRSGTMAATARALRYSPASISQQLALLEREVDAPLFVTSGRSVLLTPAGTVLAERADEILDALDDTEREVRQIGSTPVGRIRLAIFQTAALAVLPHVYEALQRNFAGIRLDVVHLEPHDALDALARHVVDLAVLDQYPGSPLPKPRSVLIQVLASDRIYLAAPPDSGSGALDAGARWALEPRGTGARRWAEMTCRTAGFEPDVQFESHDMVLHRSVVEVGLANSFMPAITLDDTAGERMRLTRLPDDPARSILLARPKAKAGEPVADTVADQLSEAFAERASSTQ